MSYINKITPPKHAVLDLDSALFLAASAAEQVKYTYKDVNGVLVAEFDSASAGANWLTEMEMFGVDARFGFTGNVDELSREVSYKVGSEKKAFDAFDTVLDSWLSHTPIEKWVGKVAAASGVPCFRNELATIQAYKGSRNGRKPHFVNSVRKYAVNNYKEISVTRGEIETDDIVMAKAEKYKSILASPDKDSLAIWNGAWYLSPEDGTLIYSDPDIVGWIELSSCGNKIKGIGPLHFLTTVLTGDNVDAIKGLPRWGAKKAFELLSPYSNYPASKLPELVQLVAEQYRDYYGEDVQYLHWSTGELIVRTWREMFIENVRLLHMLRHKKDKAELILDNIGGM